MKGYGHRSTVGRRQRSDGRQPVVELVQQSIDVALEGRATACQAQVPSRAAQQRRADLDLEARERSDTPDWVTPSIWLTSVTVVPSATCWNHRSAATSTYMTLPHGLADDCVIGRIGSRLTTLVVVNTKAGRLAALRTELHARRVARAAHNALIRDLAGYDSPSARAELSAILARHSDEDADEIRNIVNLVNAA